MDLNIRRVDRESVKGLKSEALDVGVSLRDLCIEKLGIKSAARGLKNGYESGGHSSVKAGGNGRDGGHAAVPVLPKGKGAKKRLPEMLPVRDKLAGLGDALSGLPKPEPGSGEVGSCPHGRISQAACRVRGGGC